MQSIDTRWVDAGAESADSGLLRAFFAVRLLDQRGETSPEQRFSWLVGASIAEDIRALLRKGLLKQGEPVAVSGPGSVPAAWAHVLQQHGCSSRVLPPSIVEPAFVAGLWRIDVMRGEETLIVGLLHEAQLKPGERLLNAGSHWKLITIAADGRIAASRTSLGGEVVHAVQRLGDCFDAVEERTADDRDDARRIDRREGS